MMSRGEIILLMLLVNLFALYGLLVFAKHVVNAALSIFGVPT